MASNVPAQNSMPQDELVNEVEAVVKDEAEAKVTDKWARCPVTSKTLAILITRNLQQDRRTWGHSGSTRKTKPGYSTAPVE